MVQLHENMKPVLVHNSQLDNRKVILKRINLKLRTSTSCLKFWVVFLIISNKDFRNTSHVHPHCMQGGVVYDVMCHSCEHLSSHVEQTAENFKILYFSR